MSDIFTRLLIFQIVLEIIQATLGAGLCFGPLKWRRGLLTATAATWGVFVGLVCGLILGGDGDIIILLILIGLIAFPILTYIHPGVNRFMLGFIVGSKLLYMLTTVLAKEGAMDLSGAISLPLILGAVVGIALAAWTQMRISAFILSCSFLGASQIAPVISEWANRLIYGFTGDISYLFDPVDLIFAFFKIELTDQWALIAMIIFMIIGCKKHFHRLQQAGIAPDTPIIGFEVPKSSNDQ